MKTVFIAAGGIEWGSSRMRAWWVKDALKKNHPDTWCNDIATVREEIATFKGCDNYIWQKTVDLAALAKLPGRHYWDVCDPSWWWQPEYCRQVLEHVDGVVCSSAALADDFVEWTDDKCPPFYVIPDRLDLTHFTKQRQHTAVSPVRLIWFGVSVNRLALFGALPFLERLVANGHKIELTIMDDRPDVPMQWTNAFPVYHVKWTLDSEVEILASHDVAILPPYPGAWGYVKSNNKQLTAWACGLPVTRGDDYAFLDGLMTPGKRQVSADEGLMVFDDYFNISQSAAEWEAILCAS